jgi:hypothetical protein
VKLIGQAITVILSEEARDAMERAVGGESLQSHRRKGGRRKGMERAAAGRVDPFPIAGVVQDTDELGIWLRVGSEDDKFVVLVRWEYVLSVAFSAREQERIGLRP